MAPVVVNAELAPFTQEEVTAFVPVMSAVVVMAPLLVIVVAANKLIIGCTVRLVPPETVFAFLNRNWPLPLMVAAPVDPEMVVPEPFKVMVFAPRASVPSTTRLPLICKGVRHG